MNSTMTTIRLVRCIGWCAVYPHLAVAISSYPTLSLCSTHLVNSELHQYQSPPILFTLLSNSLFADMLADMLAVMPQGMKRILPSRWE